MKNKVFISKGSTATNTQREFIDSVLEMLGIAELDPRIMNENEWSYKQPLVAIKKVMQECDGVVIIAFTRTKFENGVEVRKDENKMLSNICLPTPWNHIEAAMAYSFGLPILMIAENGLKPEGLIEQGYDWNVHWSGLSPTEVKSESFKGVLSSWKQDVLQHAKSKASTEAKRAAIEPDKLTIGTLIKSMSIPQLWALLLALGLIISSIVTAAYKLGEGKWFWQ